MRSAKRNVWVSGRCDHVVSVIEISFEYVLIPVMHPRTAIVHLLPAQAVLHEELIGRDRVFYLMRDLRLFRLRDRNY